MNDETIHPGDGGGPEIDVRDDVDLHGRLRFAAGSLAADFRGVLTLDRAEELVFTSAERLLAFASVTDFVPILAERQARRAVRSTPADLSMPLPVADAPTAPPDPPARPAPAPAPAAPVAPLLAVSDEALNRLRHGVERARARVAEWRTELTRR